MVQNIALKRSSDTVFQLEITPHVFFPHQKGRRWPHAQAARQTILFFEKLATAIVDRRNLIFFLYLCALIFSLFSQGWVKVCNDLTQYLPENTETRQGLTIMEDEFITYGTARIMLSNVTYDMAANLAAELASIDGVTSVSFGNGTEQDTPEEIAEYFKGFRTPSSPLPLTGEETDPISLSAMEEIKAEAGAL